MTDFEFPYPPRERALIPAPVWKVPDWDEDRILRLAAVLAHPIRLRILLALKVEPASPTMHGAQVNMALGVVSYHFASLERAEAVTEIANRRVRGTVEHFWQLTEFGDECLEIARAFGHDRSLVLAEEVEQATP